MKILLYADPHWCQYSSVVRMRGEKYSKRLENLIQSINWVNQLAEEEGCQEIVCLGDFFDRDDLTAEEISALSEVNIKKHWFLLGNHEMYSKDYSSNKVFERPINTPITFDKLLESTYSSNEPRVLHHKVEGSNILFLPYQKEEHRESIEDIKKRLNVNSDKLIILSHNDIKGLFYATYCSKEGYSVDEIKQECSCYINGHLHNGSLIHKDNNCKILNLGNLTGQNFSENAMNYSHCVGILDTDTLEIDLINNPYALLFFKEDIKDIKHLNIFLERLEKHTETAIVQLRISEDLIQQASDILDKCLYKRVQIEHIAPTSEQYSKLNSKDKKDIDHIAKFITYARDKYENEVNVIILEEELSKL